MVSILLLVILACALAWLFMEHRKIKKLTEAIDDFL